MVFGMFDSAPLTSVLHLVLVIALFASGTLDRENVFELWKGI